MWLLGASCFKRKVHTGPSVLNWYLSGSMLVNDMSYVMTKTPLPPKDSWLGAELYLGIKNTNVFKKHLIKLNSSLGLSKVAAGED